MILEFGEWLYWDKLITSHMLLSEAEANKHSTHINDLIFTKGKKGVSQAVGGLLYVKKKIGTKSKGTEITVKIDGAPSIVTGWIDGKFFVGSKGIFAKVPKINFTHEDINLNHGNSQGLAEKLHLALDYLKNVIPNGKIFQGDFLFDKGSLKTEIIDGIEHYTYHPNTIKYAVEKNTPLGKKISQSKIGIIFHTEYTSDGHDPKSITLKGFGVKDSDLNPSTDVWFTDAFHKNMSDIVPFSDTESKEIVNDCKSCLAMCNSIKWNKLTPELGTHFMTFINTFIRAGQVKPSASIMATMFAEYITHKAKTDEDSKKTEKGKANAKARWKDIINFISDKKNLETLFKVHSILTDTKLKIVKKLDSIKSSKTFLQKSDGTLKVTGNEGFVLATTSAGGCKLVDQYEFSNANFSPNFMKGWTH